MLRIENQAVMFALLSKYTFLKLGTENHEQAHEVIQKGMVQYGRERGARMAARARRNGDPVTLWTNQAYGEWKPDYSGQMEFGTVRTEPTFQTYISKCAWCEAWKKFDLLEYGREYCLQVDAAVYDGFGTGNVCTPQGDPMSWGGSRCEFDWGAELSDADQEKLIAKKQELGTSCMKDFTYHTAHIYSTVSNVIREELPDLAESIIAAAEHEYIDLFGEEEFAPLLKYTPADFQPKED